MGRAFVSLEKGLDILSAFDPDHMELSAQAISERVHIPLSSTYKYLELLTKKGFLTKKPNTKKFMLGTMILRLGNVFNADINLIEVALPHMKGLSKESGETVLLTVVNGWEAVCIEKVETNRLIKLSLERGTSLPLYAGASSKILLAYQEEAFIETLLEEIDLIGFTDNTITDPRCLKNELKRIRKQGYALSDSEVDLMAKAIGAPILDPKGKLVAGLSVAGPGGRINSKNLPKLIEAVKVAAQRISVELGYLKP